MSAAEQPSAARVLVRDVDYTQYVGDALDTLRTLDDGSVDCCVTSPPYWGLRDYGTGTWEGGAADCGHARQSATSRASSGLDGAVTTQGGSYAWKDICGRCGARRVDRQLGLEPTPDLYVAGMVAVFREVRRVLTDTGTLWLNLGSSYMSQGGEREYGSYKPKDLVPTPWLVAMALQADGWYLRADIVWSKSNPMPESVTDRPTKAHEYVFLLSKQPRYWFDAEAVREPSKDPADDLRRVRGDMNGYGRKHEQGGTSAFKTRDLEAVAARIAAGRNVRSVWEIATQPYPDAHFAVFPEELARRCIAAGCPEGGVVLDPFGGSGTTALVARRLGRRSILIELNETYAHMAAKRLSQLSLLAAGEVSHG